MSGLFSEDEARRIFARAAERQHARRDAETGLTLAELQEIGRSSGLNPALVAAAAAEIRAGAPARPPARSWGVDLEPRATRVIPVEMTDALWEEAVARARRTFGGRGLASTVGRAREWTSGEGSNLHLTAEPVAGGTRLTLETSRAADVPTMAILPGMGVLLSLFFAVAATLQGKVADPAAWGFVAVVFTLTVLGSLAIRQSLARWSERRRREFDALLDQIDLASRDAALGEAEPTDAAPEAARLDLDALAEPLPAPDVQALRRQTHA